MATYRWVCLPLCRAMQTGVSSLRAGTGNRCNRIWVLTHSDALTDCFIKRSFIHTGAHFQTDTDSQQNLPAKPSIAPEHRSSTVVQSTYGTLIDAAKSQTHLENREQVALVLKEFMVREKYRKGHVNFIKLVVKRMDEFDLQKDLLTYNRILDMFPKGRFAPRRMLDAFWPRSTPQLELALDILTKMEDHGIRPDYNTYMLLIEIFGKTSLPIDKCYRMAYWFDKYENADPYEIKGGLPSDPVELSRLSLERIVGTTGSLKELKPPPWAPRDSFLLTASTPSQLRLLATLGDLKGGLLYVEGPHRLWMKAALQHYYSLRLVSWREGRSREEGLQKEDKDEGPILAVCACQPGTQDLLKQWLAALQESYPSLAEATVVYDIKEPTIPHDRQLQGGQASGRTAQIAAS